MSTPSDAAGTDPSDVLLIGWGNLLLGDEGVGVHVLRRLEAEYRFEPAIALVDGGTSGMDLLPLFADYRRILMIDAIALDQPPGSIAVIRDEEIRAVLSEKLSVHHLGVTDVLAMTKLLDYPPSEIVLIGIVPERMELDLELSPTVVDVIPQVLERTGAILRDWGVNLLLQGQGTAVEAP